MQRGNISFIAHDGRVVGEITSKVVWPGRLERAMTLVCIRRLRVADFEFDRGLRDVVCIGELVGISVLLIQGSLMRLVELLDRTLLVRMHRYSSWSICQFDRSRAMDIMI
jgi:hypothetical protein